jgi:hypothetical protein
MKVIRYNGFGLENGRLYLFEGSEPVKQRLFVKSRTAIGPRVADAYGRRVAVLDTEFILPGEGHPKDWDLGNLKKGALEHWPVDHGDFFLLFPANGELAEYHGALVMVTANQDRAVDRSSAILVVVDAPWLSDELRRFTLGRVWGSVFNHGIRQVASRPQLVPLTLDLDALRDVFT